MRWLFVVLVLASSWAQAQNTTKLSQSQFDTQLSRAQEAYGQGKYGATREVLQALKTQLLAEASGNKELLGLVGYWSGLAANRQQEFSEAITEFEFALKQGYRPKDIYYEYGQALYAAEQLAKARNAFRESLKLGYKRAVCLYYLGYLSQQLKDYKKAVAFYRAIHKLPPVEQEGTLQAAEMQIGDIYLEQAEKHPDAFKAVESYVIPQYKKAQEVDPESKLAGTMQSKIIDLQQRYELVLFKMRNGRPTSIPPYFLRLSQDFTYDSNPVFAADETTNSEAKQSSMVSKTEAFGRYTFYLQDVMSISPEVRMNYTRHLKREEEIYRNDNWVVVPGVRTSLEHTVAQKPASFLLDYDFVYSQRDRDAEEDLKFNSRTQTISIGERFAGFLWGGDTTLRLRTRSFDSYNDDSNSRTKGASLEQIIPTQKGYLWILNLAYDQTRVVDESFDTNTTFLRTDVIFPQTKSWKLTPQLGCGITITDPINDSGRGQEQTFNPSLRVSRSLGKRFRTSFHADYMQNDSKDEENFAYRKTFWGVELEYIF